MFADPVPIACNEPHPPVAPLLRLYRLQLLSIMGAGASAPGAFQKLPDPVDEATAMAILGKCFDRADWETITGGSGKVAKDTFITTITVRNHAPSLRAWLEFWRIDELLATLESLGKLLFPCLSAPLPAG